jgi:hypothetical protein
MWLLGAGCSSDAPPETHESIPIITLEKVASVADGVALGWFVFEAKDRGANGDVLSPKPISHFTVERQAFLTGKWILATTLPPSARTYLDPEVEYGGRYLYRITSHFVDGRRTSFETADPVNGPPLWSFKFINPSKPAEAAKGMVYVKIVKFEKGYGKVEAKRIQYDGDRLGFWEETPGAEPTFVHRVSLPTGKAVEVDFNTGATLKSVLPTKLVVQVNRCRVIYDKPSGDRVGCDQVVEPRTLQVHQVIYRDSQGLHQVTVPDPGNFDQLCDHHQKNPDEPPKDPRLLQARLVLDEADRLWDIDSPSSIRAYQRLLKDYRDIVVRLHVRNRVEGRARQADDK